MRHRLSVAVALFLAFAAYSFQVIQMPGRVLACYCTEQSLAEVVEEGQVTVVAGVVGPAQPDRTPVVLDAWFHGAFRTNVVWLRTGTNSVSSCDVFMSVGERRLMVLHGGPIAPGANGLYSSSLCSPNAVIGTAEGDALFAEAVGLFGPAEEQPASEPVTSAPAELAPWVGGGLVWAAAAFGIGMLLFGGLILVARRRPTP